MMIRYVIRKSVQNTCKTQHPKNQATHGLSPILPSFKNDASYMIETNCTASTCNNIPVCLAVGKNTMILKSGFVFIW